jgi:hypothetical protein
MSQTAMLRKSATNPVSLENIPEPKSLRKRAFALAEVSDKSMGMRLRRVKLQKQAAIDRKATEQLRAFLDRIANKD